MAWKPDSIIRLGILLFVLVIVVYFIYSNERSRNNRESYVNVIPDEEYVEQESTNVDKMIEAISDLDQKNIYSVYNDLLKRDPTPLELLSAYDMYVNNNKTTDALINSIKFTDEYKDKNGVQRGPSELTATNTSSNNSALTFPLSLIKNEVTTDTTANATAALSETKPPYADSIVHVNTDKESALREVLLNTDTEKQRENKRVNMKQKLDMYRIIVEVFEDVLSRLPNNGELEQYYQQMIADNSFDRSKLRQILLASDEYKRMQKLQTNQVHAELPGNVTDAQITMKVIAIYQSIHASSHPNAELLDFLKSKYVEYNLNDAQLRSLIILMKAIDENKDVSGYNASSDNSGASFNTSIAPAALAATDANSSSQRYIYNNPNVYNIISSDPQEIKSILQNLEKEKANVASKPWASDDADADNANSATNNFSPEACKALFTAQEQQPMSKLIEKRNMDELSSSCARNRYYMSIDKKLGYYGAGTGNDENRRTTTTTTGTTTIGTSGTSDIYAVRPLLDDSALFGTPLEEASKTAVGSLMPGFIYKEMPYIPPK